MSKKNALSPAAATDASADGFADQSPDLLASEPSWSGQPLFRQTKLADQIYEKIVQEIVGGKLRQGQKLPSETDLCKSFGVSRPILREALARLKADGLLLARQGSGNYVRLQPEADFLSFAPNGSIAEILRGFEFRVGVEGEAAFLAAKRRSKEDLETISNALAELRRATHAGEVGNDPDYQFHMAIANAAQNELFASTIKELHRTMVSGMNIARNLSLRKPAARALLVQEEHDAIFHAIARGNGAEARRTMRTHITNARLRMLSRDVE
ncbi:MAG TPA: FadR/GntR family transcriptional regulator [Burkholderiaceae bacterium]|nr:FadR/GntR family transcriptional regulator [Burkholderiaceae bacterium]